MRERTERLLDGAQTALGRGRVRLVMNKIAKFEQLKARQDAVVAAKAETDKKNRALVESGAPTGDGRYDGVGRLSPLGSKRRDYPQYALVDGRGQVVVFVNPAPGVNLRPYLNKDVGVVGPKSYATGLQKQQISAQRVAVLGGTTLR